MAEKALPDLPAAAAADVGGGGQRAGFGSPEKGRWGPVLGEDDGVKEQVRSWEYDSADAA